MFANREQLQEILKKANQYAREKAKESGASIYYIKNNKRVREDAEGKKPMWRYLQAGVRLPSI